MIRIVVVALFLVVSVGLVLAAFQTGADTRSGTLLINLGTEIFGVFITIAVVEWFLERRRKQDRARELAWSTLHALQRAVWVWQGGPREMKTDEMLGLIAGIRSQEPPEPVTRALLATLGSHARETLDLDSTAIRTTPALRPALEDLTSLRSLSDGGQVSVRMVAEILEASTQGLARMLGLPCQRIPAALINYRDPSPEGQVERFHEDRPGSVGLGPAAGSSLSRRGRAGPRATGTDGARPA
jgi:hypothetical protein